MTQHPLSWVRTEKPENMYLQRYTHPVFTAALLTMASTEPTKVSFHRRLDKYDVVTYAVEDCSAMRRNEMRPFATTWIDLEKTVLGTISQPEKGKSLMTSLIRGI